MTQDNPLMNNPRGDRPDPLLAPGAASLPPSERPSATPAPVADFVPKEAVKPFVKAPDDSVAGVIDTVEAIIIALILALTFRAFVIEAFVIPTGSMAPTLLGAHFQVTCPKCGYAFDENADLRYQLQDPRQPRVEQRELVNSSAVPAPNHRFCPNCGYDIFAEQLPDLTRDHPLAMENMGREYPTFLPWANNGDRILVLKYLYSLESPHRFDVIVFKEPMFAKDNFIKRLIGLPGETIEIIGGDLYIGQGPQAQGDAGAAHRFIARKPRYIQNALWQLIYDNDYYPIDEGQSRTTTNGFNRASDRPEERLLPPWNNPWNGRGPTAAAWDIHGPTLKYNSDAPGLLHFTLGDEAADTRTVPDFYAWNILGYDNDAITVRESRRYPVGDLHLECVWTPTAAAGTSFVATIGKPEHRFRATLESAGTAKLERWTGKAFEPVTPTSSQTLSPLAPGRPCKIEMNNVDRRVELLVNGTLAVSYETLWTAQDALKSKATEELSHPLIEIGVGGNCTISHLKLMRDLYYTQAGDTGHGQQPTTPITAYAGAPLTLGEDEFFALGDNSTFSHDGRTWREVFPALDDLALRPGIVPRRYLLGRAFFVYWPAGFRLLGKPKEVPFGGNIVNSPLIPNTGDMRFIR